MYTFSLLTHQVSLRLRQSQGIKPSGIETFYYVWTCSAIAGRLCLLCDKDTQQTHTRCSSYLIGVPVVNNNI